MSADSNAISNTQFSYSCYLINPYMKKLIFMTREKTDADPINEQLYKPLITNRTCWIYGGDDRFCCMAGFYPVRTQRSVRIY